MSVYLDFFRACSYFWTAELGWIYLLGLLDANSSDRPGYPDGSIPFRGVVPFCEYSNPIDFAVLYVIC